MFRPKTVFVLGAGASKEAGLPVGSELSKKISEKLWINVDRRTSSLTSGDQAVFEALKKCGNGDATQYVKAGWRISEGINLASSIDNFIDQHVGDTLIEQCGKIAIAHSIAESERQSSLFRDNRGSHMSKKRLPGIDGTWYQAFFQILGRGVYKNNIESIFNGISIISFNYDRCIEWFLAEALDINYGIGDQRAREIVATLRIYHPFGSIGQLIVDGEIAVPFGGRGESPEELLEMAKGIRTYNERISNQTELDEIRECIREAEFVVFLGCAYHKPNLAVLTPQARPPIRDEPIAEIYGTAFEISNSDCGIIKHHLQPLSHRTPKIHLHQITCNALFKEYMRTFEQ